MLKRISIFLILIIFVYGCDYSPIHTNKKNNIEIKITSITGDQEINDYLYKDLKRKSKNSSEKIEVKVNTSFTKRILAKNTKSFATDYESALLEILDLKIGLIIRLSVME